MDYVISFLLFAAFVVVIYAAIQRRRDEMRDDPDMTGDDLPIADRMDPR